MAANPYVAPQARVADISADTEYAQLNMWSAQGRIGRLRYLAYTFGALFVTGVVSAVLTGVLGPSAGLVATVLAYISLVIFCVLASIRRSHDMNWTGWTVLLSLLPFVGLIWVFKAGSEGLNDYGHRPPPNTIGVKVLALLFPITFILGIVAAIAVPAYMQYVDRAQVQQR